MPDPLIHISVCYLQVLLGVSRKTVSHKQGREAALRGLRDWPRAISRVKGCKLTSPVCDKQFSSTPLTKPANNSHILL